MRSMCASFEGGGGRRFRTLKPTRYKFVVLGSLIRRPGVIFDLGAIASPKGRRCRRSSQGFRSLRLRGRGCTPRILPKVDFQFLLGTWTSRLTPRNPNPKTLPSKPEAPPNPNAHTADCEDKRPGRSDPHHACLLPLACIRGFGLVVETVS